MEETESMEIEYYEKGKDILLVLTGIGGGVKGFDNKYVRIAQNVMERHGFSVVIATTPSGSWSHTEQNLNWAMAFVKTKLKSGGKVYVMGHSAGANIVLWHSKKFPQIEKILAVNPVMNINLHLSKEIKDVPKETHIVFGEHDPSRRYAPLLPACEHVKVHILPNIDHSFTDNLDVFVNLPSQILFGYNPQPD